MHVIALFLLLLISGCSATSTNSPSTSASPPSQPTSSSPPAEEPMDEVAVEIILTLTKQGEKPAAATYAKILAARKTEKVEAAIKKTRVDVTRRRIEQLKTMNDFILFQASFAVGVGLPGDAEVSKLVRDEAADIGKGLSAPDGLQDSQRVLAVIKKFGGTDADLAATGFEDMFGPGLANGTIGDDGRWKAFVSFFPNSKYIEERKAFEEAETKQAQERTDRLQEAQADQAKEREAAEKAHALDSDFTDMFETVRDVALKRSQANFALAHSNMMRRPAQGRAAAQMVLGEANRILKEDFCPAKKAYLKTYGAKAFQDRVKRQCDEDPPIGQAEFGREVRLDAECRSIFGSGC